MKKHCGHSDYLNLFDSLDFSVSHHDPDHFATVNALIDLIPASIYWKNSKGYYLGRNQYAATKMISQGFESNIVKNHVLGKTDYDFFTKEIADQFKDNDRAVISGKLESVHFIESLILPAGNMIDQVSIKKMFQNQKGETYVIGCTIDTSDFIPASKLALDEFMRKFLRFMVIPTPQLLSEIVNNLRCYAVHFSASPQLRHLLFFSERELECVCLLTRGASAKQIGYFLNISHRTVEVFIDRVRKKLDISCKSKIIDWFWEVLSKL